MRTGRGFAIKQHGSHAYIPCRPETDAYGSGSLSTSTASITRPRSAASSKSSDSPADSSAVMIRLRMLGCIPPACRQKLDGRAVPVECRAHAHKRLVSLGRWSREPIHCPSSCRAECARNAAASGANPRFYFTDSTLFGSYKRIAC